MAWLFFKEGYQNSKPNFFHYHHFQILKVEYLWLRRFRMNEDTCYLWDSLCFEYCWWSKICTNTSNKDLSHYFSKTAVDFRQRKNLNVKQKDLLLNHFVVKNKTDANILITWLISKFVLKSKDVLYQISSDLGEARIL